MKIYKNGDVKHEASLQKKWQCQPPHLCTMHQALETPPQATGDDSRFKEPHKGPKS